MLKPSDLDRNEIPRIAARLAEIYAERKKEKIEPAGHPWRAFARASSPGSAIAPGEPDAR